MQTATQLNSPPAIPTAPPTPTEPSYTRAYQVQSAVRLSSRRSLAQGHGYRQELLTEIIYLCPRHAYWVTAGTDQQPANDISYPNAGPTYCWACHIFDTTDLIEIPPSSINH